MKDSVEPYITEDGREIGDVMLDLRALGVSGEEFALRLLAEEKIAVMPGESFGEVAGGFVRIALTIADDDLADALARLRRFAEGFAA